MKIQLSTCEALADSTAIRVFGWRQIEQLQDGRCNVDQLHGLAALRRNNPPRPGKDQRHAHGRVVHEETMGQFLVFAERFTVIGGQHDQQGPPVTGLSSHLQQFPDPVEAARTRAAAHRDHADHRNGSRQTRAGPLSEPAARR